LGWGRRFGGSTALVVDDDAGNVALDQPAKILFLVEQEAPAPKGMLQPRAFQRMHEHAQPNFVERHFPQHRT
jgi:hypothetical protein